MYGTLVLNSASFFSHLPKRPVVWDEGTLWDADNFPLSSHLLNYIDFDDFFFPSPQCEADRIN